MADLLSGNVKLMVDSVASALPHIQAGKVIPIAVTTPERAPQLPDVPTIAETVAPGYGAYGWTGLCAPAGTPEAIIQKVNADVGAILRQPAVRQRVRAHRAPGYGSAKATHHSGLSCACGPIVPCARMRAGGSAGMRRV